ncbi:hypothetical protein G3O00_34710, partial [Burkholderia sp. Ac-20384]|nr:hypothetical protein [Burkholderia sp. Ac-20384]
KQWNVDPASCRAANGEVQHPPSGRRASYGQLADAAAKLPVPNLLGGLLGGGNKK